VTKLSHKSPFVTSIVLLLLLIDAGCMGRVSAARGDDWPAMGKSAGSTDAAPTIGGSAVQLTPAAPFFPSDAQRKIHALVDRFLSALFQIDPLKWLGIAVLLAMLLFYSLENRSPIFILAFAMACGLGSVFGFLEGSRLIAAGGIVGGICALRKFWHEIRSWNGILLRSDYLVLAWIVRTIALLAVFAGLTLLLVDSPIGTRLPMRIDRSVAEAFPLLLVGIAYLAWLATERPAVIDLVKQLLIALAFILWGVSLLMPAGPAARLLGAVVIAIYVFDLAWMMEDNLRKKLGSDADRKLLRRSPAGVGSWSDGASLELAGRQQKAAG
jgi:hypothetical protein